MNLKSKPLVSVVTPVYNTEKYLADCIESVLGQSYDHWEYVIVNNCSTDRSLEIAQHYAGQDDRIRIHNNSRFLNQMENWNHAMRQISAESQYCKVVHADDWLFPACLAQMVAVAEADPSVGMVGAYRLDEDQVNLDGLPYPSPAISGRNLCRSALLGGPYLFGSPTSLLIRSDLVRARPTFYNEANIHADKEVCYDLLQNSDFGFVHQVLTYTRRHNETTTTFIRRFETYRIGHLIILKKYGPIYLTPEEYERRLKQRIEAHYKFLGEKVFELKEKAFWRYHKNELEKLGFRFSRAKIIKAALWQMLNFKDTVRLIRLSLRKEAESGTVKDMKRWNIIGAQES